MVNVSSQEARATRKIAPPSERENSLGLEWARIADDAVLVASSERAWLLQPHPCAETDPFVEPMSGDGHLETTRSLLDAAVQIPSERFAHVKAPPLTLAQYTWKLVGDYHATHAIPRLIQAAEARFRSAGRADLAAIAGWQVRNETGHDELALRDLEALGYSRSAVERSAVPALTAAVVAYAERCVQGERPVMIFGLYAGERTVICTTREAIQAVEALLPPGVKATRCLRVHSAIGADVKHVSGLLERVARLPAADRALIARAVYEVATLLYSRPEPGVSGETLRQLLAS